MTHLFVYGSLVRPTTLHEVLGHLHRGERYRARLRGYACVEVPGYDYPTLVERPGEGVDGIVVMDLSPRDLASLDAYEDVAGGTYVRVPVEVQAEGCGPANAVLRAETYVAGPLLLARLTTRDYVRLGSRVTVQGEDGEDTYHLVPASQANPRRRLVSAESPIGRALLGKRVGDQVTIVAPGGSFRLTVTVVDEG